MIIIPIDIGIFFEINEVSEDLTDLEIEKFRGLIEDVDYSDADSYKEKLSTLKESYFPKQQPVNEQSTEEQGESDVVETSDSMAKYLEASFLSSFLKYSRFSVTQSSYGIILSESTHPQQSHIFFINPIDLFS